MLQNGWASDWDNVAFDLSLKAILSQRGPAQFSSIHSNPDGSVTLRITGPVGSGWRVECADSPNASASWQKVQSLVIDSTNATTVKDIGEGGRARPGSADARFYRLVPEN